VELPLVGGTLALWLVAPETCLRDALGIPAPGAPEILLLRMNAATTGSLVFVLYAWLLTRDRVHHATFRAFQACLGIGDLLIVLASVFGFGTSSRPAVPATQLGLAAGWGLVRIRYLLRRG
jgi:hypothetical protein